MTLKFEIAKRVAENFGATNETFNKCGITFDDFLIKNVIHIKNDDDTDVHLKVYGAEVKLGEQVLCVLVCPAYAVLSTDVDTDYLCVWCIDNNPIHGVVVNNAAVFGDVLKFHEDKWNIISDKTKANILIGAILLSEQPLIWSKINDDLIQKLFQPLCFLVESDTVSDNL